MFYILVNWYDLNIVDTALFGHNGPMNFALIRQRYGLDQIILRCLMLLVFLTSFLSEQSGYPD